MVMTVSVNRSPVQVTLFLPLRNAAEILVARIS